MLNPQTTDHASIARTILIPFPTARFAKSALRALSVDKELSPLVIRSFQIAGSADDGQEDGSRTLEVCYAAMTNRMLRVAMNGFFESLGVVVHVMEELDVDVVDGEVKESLEGVQGLEKR